MSENKGIFDPAADVEKPADLRPSSQKPMATRPSEYVETGFLSVGPAPDGGVLIGGGDPPGPALGLTDDNLICLENEKTGRQACDFFVQWVTEAEGVIKGFGEQPRQIRCYCTKLATASELMEVGELAVFACSARRPIDVRSGDIIRDFRRRQRELADEFNQTSSETEM